MTKRGHAFIRVFGTLIFSFLLSACSSRPDGSNALVYGLTLSPTGIDPHLNASAELGIPLSSVYDTLVVFDTAAGLFKPGLARSWEIAPDGLTYTFHLREDVLFHDGTNFNAEAVRANLEYTLDPDHHSQKAAAMIEPLQSVEVIDSYTVALHLSRPYAPLLDSLSQVYLGMASPKALEEWGPQDYQFHQVGTGPFRFVEYIPNDHITIERNPAYRWAPETSTVKEASIHSITFEFYEDPATRSIALTNGDADVIGEIPPHDAERLSREGAFQLFPVPIPGQPLQYLFNTQRPPTDDLLVRQALIAGVDREEINRAVFGPYSPLSANILSSAHFGLDEHTAQYLFDPDQAASLLDQAGWVRSGSSQYRQKGDAVLEVDLVAPIWGSNPEVAQMMKAAWENLGVKVNLDIAAGFGPLKEIQAGNQYHAIGINFFGTDADLLRSFYRSDGLYNWSGYRNENLDEALDRASEAFDDPAGRADLYNKIADHIIGQALVLPIRDYTNLVIANPRVDGLRYSTQGWFPILIEAELGS
jgi:peptide/nickel transport system substrate-binding protein